MDPASQPPSSTPPPNPTALTPTTGGGANGDNTVNNGDKPVAVPPSSAVVQQQEQQEAVAIQTTQAAQAMNLANQAAQMSPPAAPPAVTQPVAASAPVSPVQTLPAAPAPTPTTSTAASTTPISVPVAPSAQPLVPAPGQIPPVTTTPSTPSIPPAIPAKPPVPVDNRDQLVILREKIAQSTVPDGLRKTLNERVERLEIIRKGAGNMSSTYIMEFESTQRYIKWVADYPWQIKSTDTLDLKKAREILDRDHFGLDMLKNRMLEYIASIMLNLQNNGPDYATQSPILCFVGLAGTGKTTFAMSIAEALHRQFVRIPFGGMADSRVLRGQSRFFPDAEPGQVYKGMVQAKTLNPVLLFDELDRVTETARADIMGVLIELLDPGQNNAFSDHYIDYPVNLSNCLFVATANNVTAIATAVIDRLEIIQMPSYNDEEKTHIGRDYVFPKVSKLIGLKPEQLTIDPAVWEIVIRPLGYDPGIRGLERLINMMCRKAARMIVAGEAKNVKITPDNVKIFTQEF
ncbi:MAG: AAA family ATPase [Candidatus Levyibacteriota bacterium]